MAAMHEDDSPELSEVAKVLGEILEVNSFCFHLRLQEMHSLYIFMSTYASYSIHLASFAYFFILVFHLLVTRRPS